MTNTLSQFKDPKDKLIIALDNFKTLTAVEELITQTSEYAGWYKVGLESIMNFGVEQMAEILGDYGVKMFLDGKFHDIPNTVMQAVIKLKQHDVEMFNVHCSNGLASMEAAAKNKGNMIALGVTVLTSHDNDECFEIFGNTVNQKVLQFARTAVDAGLDGIVCSPLELELLSKDIYFDDLLKITPGIQPAFMPKNDQKRTTTAKEAILSGATALVVGRAITNDANPEHAARLTLEEITEAMSEKN